MRLLRRAAAVHASITRRSADAKLQVLVIHGDGPKFHFTPLWDVRNQPTPCAARLEVMGDPITDAVVVHVDPSQIDSRMFSARPLAGSEPFVGPDPLPPVCR